MKEQWIQYLCDPLDHSELQFSDISERSGEWIISGTLRSGSGRIYPIKSGIPVFVTGQTQSTESVKSFAYEWTEFGFLYAKAGWETDIINPLVESTEFFRDKVVVDAGAGSGSQSRWMAEAGAKLVFALELNEGIFTAVKQSIAPFKDRVFPIQCDIAHPPLRVKPDALYCFNVIQHTENPRITFSNLVSLLPSNGLFLFNIYTKRLEARYQMTRLVRYLIRPLPFTIWKWIAFLLAAGAHPVSRIPGLRGPVNMFLPTSHSFKETWLDIYDVFGSHHYQAYMTRAEQRELIAEHRLRILKESLLGYLLARDESAAERKQPAPKQFVGG